jgi:hypothetical protein
MHDDTGWDAGYSSMAGDCDHRFAPSMRTGTFGALKQWSGTVTLGKGHSTRRKGQPKTRGCSVKFCQIIMNGELTTIPHLHPMRLGKIAENNQIQRIGNSVMNMKTIMAALVAAAFTGIVVTAASAHGGGGAPGCGYGQHWDGDLSACVNGTPRKREPRYSVAARRLLRT